MARQLEENGIKLRAPEPEDLDCMFRFENIVDLWDISNTTGPYSRFHLKQYIEQTQNDLFTDRQLRLMIENSDRQVVGIVDICNFDPLHRKLFTTCGYQECALLKDWMHTGKGYRDVIMLQKINF